MGKVLDGLFVSALSEESADSPGFEPVTSAPGTLIQQLGERIQLVL